MREATQKKLDKVIKLIDKGYKPTNACKKVGLAYNVYKIFSKNNNERVEVKNMPMSSKYKEKTEKFQEASDAVDDAINALEMHVQQLSEENYKLKQFIKDFLWWTIKS